ncbi:hypothetical protein H4R35_002619 [Dimargaris xerosporica]|nr:hypothetical protein H4R35_002619 [Dimargaris xerosporica]
MNDAALDHVLSQTWDNLQLLARCNVLSEASFESISRRLPPRPASFHRSWNPFARDFVGRGGDRFPPGPMGGGQFGPGPGRFASPDLRGDPFVDRMAQGAGLRRSNTAAPHAGGYRRGFGGGPFDPMGPGGPSPSGRPPMSPRPPGYGGRDEFGPMGGHANDHGSSGKGQPPLLPGGRVPRFVRAMYVYDQSFDGAMSIKPNDIIEVLATDPSNWWTGRLQHGMMQGLFPATYTVPVLPDDPLVQQFERMNMGGGGDPAMGGGRSRSRVPSPHPYGPSAAPMANDSFVNRNGGATSPYPQGPNRGPSPYLDPGMGGPQRPMSSRPDMHGSGSFPGPFPPSSGPPGPGFGYGSAYPVDGGPRPPPPGMGGGDFYGSGSFASRGPPNMRRRSFNPSMLGDHPSRHATPGMM